MDFLPASIYINIAVLVVAFFVLSKGATFLVDGAVGVAARLMVPKVIIGIVLVGFGTTMPEFTVSLISAIQGHSEIALGNAVGSVIVNVAVALALGVLFAPVALKLDKSVFRTVGLIFFAAAALTLALALNGRIGRIEGAVLLCGLAGYLAYLLTTEKRKKNREFEREAVEEVEEVEAHIAARSMAQHIGLFTCGLALVVVASKFLVEAAVNVAELLNISETIIGLTIVAIGTSLPEVATCIVASRKGHGDLAFGDIMGANILNLLWIIGGAALARPIVVTQGEILFMFPCMIGVVALMFLLARVRLELNRWKSLILVASYVAYALATIFVFFPGRT